MHTIIKFDAGILECTQREWREFLDRQMGVIPASDYEGSLLKAEQFVQKKSSPYEFIYSVPKDQDSCVADLILTVMYAAPNRHDANDAWLKLLDVRPAPWYNSGVEYDATRLPEVLPEVIVEVLSLTYETHPSSRLKIYGHEPMGREFLQAMAGTLRKISALSISAHGNWLVIDKK
ncbi:MAG: hypothetical protein HQL98_14180 [Magnetococcales bacterium]|nr:hypothetical protein [Magnetococcales bacterium]